MKMMYSKLSRSSQEWTIPKRVKDLLSQAKNAGLSTDTFEGNVEELKKFDF